MSGRSSLLAKRSFKSHPTASTEVPGHPERSDNANRAINLNDALPSELSQLGVNVTGTASSPTGNAVSSSDKDLRVENGFQELTAIEELERHAESVLISANIAFDTDTLHDVVSTIRKTNHFYAAAFEGLLEVGRALNSLQNRVGSGGYKALVKANLIRVNEATASKLRQIAAAIDNQKIPSDLIRLVPRTLNGAYIIASIPAEEIEPMMREMVRLELLPDAPTRKLEAAVKRLRMDTRPQIADLQFALERKLKARESLDREISEIREALRISSSRHP